MDIAAILTGKKKSSLKGKNLLKINGKPLFYYPCNAAKKIKEINFFYTSSDCEKILKLSKKYGFSSIKRPHRLATSASKHVDVLKHSIKYLEKKNIFPEILVVLLANAPIIKTKWIKDCINKIKNNKNLSAVVPVLLNNDHNPLRAKKIKKNILYNFINKKKISSNRQDLPNSFFLSHNFWVIRTKSIIENNGFPPWSFMGKKVSPYILDYSIDIHTLEDYHLAKILISK